MTIPIPSELAITKSLITRLSKSFIVLNHTDMRTSGIPDISVTSYGITTWIELKIRKGNREPKSSALQRYNAEKLSGGSIGVFSACLFIIFDAEMTYVVPPRAFNQAHGVFPWPVSDEQDAIDRVQFTSDWLWFSRAENNRILRLDRLAYNTIASMLDSRHRAIRNGEFSLAD